MNGVVVMELKLEHITHMYGNLCALNDVSFSLTPGVYGLLGPNGSGKSTMMNILTGNLKQTSGTVIWNGKTTDSNNHSFYHTLGYMPQIQTFYPDFSAMEFMYYIASLKNMDRKEAETDICSILIKLELYEVRNRKIRSFSGGMKQRLLLGQALLNHPSVLILDEPTAGMDPKQRITISKMIGELSRDKIILISTHVVSDIEFIAKEIILLKKGKIIQKDSVSNLCQSISGKVFDVHLNDEAMEEFERDHKKLITGYVRDMNGIKARIIRDTEPSYSCMKAIPNLEDVYMYSFGESDHVF